MSWTYALKEATVALLRSRFSGLLSVLITGVAIFFLGIFALTVSQGWQVLQHLKSQIQMEVFLDDAASDDLIHALRLRLEKRSEVDSLVFVSKAQALAEFQKEFGQDVTALLGENPLPASFRLYLNPRALTTEDIRKLKQEIESWNGVDEVVYRFDLLQAFERYFRIAIVVAVSIGGFLILVSILLISHTIRLTIHAKRDSIEIMSLVGAKPSFIRRPFLLEGTLQGLLGGLLAVAALYLLVWLVHLFLPTLTIDLRPFALGLILWSVLIGAVGSYLGIRGLLSRMIR